MSVWSNDSGSGFEHTKSLYVGRNGGPYLVREWKNDEEIARPAAENIARFYRVLRDAAAEVNPRFRVITRLESFYGERRASLASSRRRDRCRGQFAVDVGLGEQLPPSGLSGCPGPRIGLHNRLAEKEAGRPGARLHGEAGLFLSFLRQPRESRAASGHSLSLADLRKTRRLRRRWAFRTLAHMGGLHPPDKVPYAVNQEVFRAFQFDAGLDIEDGHGRIAERYAGRRGTRPRWSRAGGSSKRRSGNSCPCRSTRVSERSGTGCWSGRWCPISTGFRRRSGLITRTGHGQPAPQSQQGRPGQGRPLRADPQGLCRNGFPPDRPGVWKPLDAAVRLFRAEERDASRAGDDPARRVFEDQAVRAEAFEMFIHDAAERRRLDLRRPRVSSGRRTRGADAAAARSCGDMIDREIANARALIRLSRETAGQVDDGLRLRRDALHLRGEFRGAPREENRPDGTPPERPAVHRSGLHVPVRGRSLSEVRRRNSRPGGRPGRRGSSPGR